VELSLSTDSTGFPGPRPVPRREAALTGVLDQVITRGAALRTVREGSERGASHVA
jgi:hypothetical protein